ncbi:MAG: hypothetical protein PUP92_06925 [Rhizonema sp. PD38]|nr:hypothetical protein [Rhizonema sp. PD38]
MNAEWHLGVAATGLDIKNRTVELANGVDAERLVVRHRLLFDQLLKQNGRFIVDEGYHPSFASCSSRA